MESDREILCGPKGRHQVERPAWRGGSVDSQVTLGGRQIELPRLRVRSADGEVPLASFQWAAATDPLDEHTLAAVAEIGRASSRLRRRRVVTWQDPGRPSTTPVTTYSPHSPEYRSKIATTSPTSGLGPPLTTAPQPCPTDASVLQPLGALEHSRQQRREKLAQ